MRVAIVLGHHKNKKGAFSEYFKQREWDFYNEVLNCSFQNNIFYHDENISGYTSRIKNTANKLNKIDFDLVIELHFNSAVDSRANGCETLYYFASKKGKQYAQKFSNLVNKRTGIKLRNGGVKSLANRNDRGFASVYYTKAPTIMIEPFFGNNSMDCAKIQSHDNMAKILDEYINSLK
jgi:N-acetylmuramoyl-L-alanine amidase